MTIRHTKLQKILGHTLIKLRKQAGKNRAEVSRESGLDYRFMQDLENGKKLPGIKSLLVLAAALETTPNEILEPLWKEWNKAGQPDFNGRDEDS